MNGRLRRPGDSLRGMTNAFEMKRGRGGVRQYFCFIYGLLWMRYIPILSNFDMWIDSSVSTVTLISYVDLYVLIVYVMNIGIDAKIIQYLETELRVLCLAIGAASLELVRVRQAVKSALSGCVYWIINPSAHALASLCFPLRTASIKAVRQNTVPEARPLRAC